MSKRTQVCKYKFKQGSRKGKKCNRNCRGDFCCDHKLEKIEYLSKYYKISRDKVFHNKLKKLKTKSINNISLPKEKDRLIMYCNEKLQIFRELVGVNIFLEIDQKKNIEILKKKIYGKCTCFNITNLQDISTDLYEKLEKEEDYKAYCKDNMLQYIQESYECDQCHNYEIDLCKYCHPPFGKILFNEFIGSNELAKLKKKRLEKQFENLQLKIEQQHKIIKLIDKKQKYN